MNVTDTKILDILNNANEESDSCDIVLDIEYELQKLRKEDKSTKVKNILVVRLNAIGDMIVSSAFLRELRRNYKNAHITLIVAPNVIPVIELCPYINEIIPFESKDIESDKSLVSIMKKVYAFVKDKLSKRQYQLAFSLRFFTDNFSSLCMMWLSGAKERVGYDLRPYRWWISYIDDIYGITFFLNSIFLTTDLIPPKNMLAEHDRNFYALKRMGLSIEEVHMELFYSNEDLETAKNLLKDLDPIPKKIILGIGGSIKSKKYPVDKYVTVMKELSHMYDLYFILVGSKEEVEDSILIEESMKSDRIINLVNKTSIREVEAVISLCDAYMGNDTCHVHIAAAAQKPVLVLYREPMSIEDKYPFLSACKIFPPYNTTIIQLRPMNPYPECSMKERSHEFRYGICRYINRPHCILQINPKDIIENFIKLYNAI